MEDLSHIDEQGRARMVDVSSKNRQLRIAKASGKIYLANGTLDLIMKNSIRKGEVLRVAEIAGIQAAKRTWDLIPLCHPLEIGKIDVNAESGNGYVNVKSEVTCVGKTGVEMEALTAVSVALLTVYDMCKAVDKNMVIGEIKLQEKVKYDIRED